MPELADLGQINVIPKLLIAYGQLVDSGVVVEPYVDGDSELHAADLLAERYGSRVPIVWAWNGDKTRVVHHAGWLIHPGFNDLPARFVLFQHLAGGGELLHRYATALGLRCDPFRDDRRVKVWLTPADPNMGREVGLFCMPCSDERPHEIVHDAYPYAPGAYLGHCTVCGTQQMVDRTLLDGK